MARVSPGAAHRPSLARRITIEAHAIWLATRDPRTPLPARLLGWFVAAYALSPIDLIPDFIPVIGLLDDAIVIGLGAWLLERMIPDDLMEEHRASAQAAASQPTMLAGAALIIAAWAIALVAGYMLVKFFWG
ncbi:MAG: YkvA family protein [Sphingomonas sp.]